MYAVCKCGEYFDNRNTKCTDLINRHLNNT